MASREGGSRRPHPDGRHGLEASEAPREASVRRWKVGALPASSRLGQPAAGLRAHGCHGCGTPCRLTRGRTTCGHAACSNTGPGGGPHPQDDAPRCATGRTAGRTWWRGLLRGRLVPRGVAQPDPQADGRQRESTTRVEKAAVAAFHTAMRQAMREAPAATLHAVEWGGAEAGAAHFPGGKGDGAVREAHATVVRDGDRADRRGEGGASGVAVVLSLTVDMPGDGPDLGIAGLQQARLEHGGFAERTGDGGERLHRHQAGGAGGGPGRAVRGEATAGHPVMEVRVVRELPPPGRQDSRAPQARGPDEALLFGELVQGPGRCLHQSLRCETLRRAAQGTQGLRDRAGQETVRPRELWGPVGLEPRRGCLLLPRGAVAVATGMLDAVLARAVVTRREAGAVGAALALLEGADARTVGGGERRSARQGLGGQRRAARTQGEQGTRPGRRAWRRSSASSGPVWVRWT